MRPLRIEARNLRALLRVLGIAGLGLALGRYAATPDAFQRLWVPLAGALGGAHVEAQSGQLSWSGELRAEGLVWRASGVAIDLDELALAVEPLSCLPGRTTRLRWLHASGGEVRLALVPDAQGAVEPEVASPGLALPRIDEARVERMNVTIERAGETLRAGPLQLELTGLGAARGGGLLLETPVALEAPDAPVRRGSLRASLTLDERSAGARPFAAEAELALDAEAGILPERIELRAEGVASSEGELQLRALTLAAEREGAELVSLALSGTSLGGALDLRGTLHSSSPAALARLVDLPLAPFFDVGSQLGGELAVVRGASGALRGEARLRFQALSLSGEEAPAELRLEGRLDWQEGLLSIAEVTATAFAPGGAALGSLGAEGRLALGAPAASRLELELREVQLAPWLAALGAPLGASGPLPTSGEIHYDDPPEGDASVEGELRVTLPAPLPESGDLEYTLRPALAVGDAGLGGRLEIEGRAADRSADGRAELAFELKSRGDANALDVDATVGSLDLTPLGALWSREGSLGVGGEAAARPASAGAPLALSLEAEVGALRLGELVARDGSLELARRDGRLALRITAGELAGGAARASYERSRAESGERVTLRVHASGVRLAPLLSALALDPDGRFRGALTLHSELEAAPTQRALLAGAHGRLRFALTNGELARSRVQDVIAQETALPEFRLIRFDRADGDYLIRDGRLEIGGLRLDGPLVNLAIRGALAADGVQLRINPRVGPDLARRVPTHLARYLADTVGGALALPLVVDVAGPYGAIRVSTRPAPPSLLGTLFDGVTGLARIALRPGSNGEAPPGDPAPPARPGATTGG